MRQPILTASLLVAACGMLTACDLFSGEPDEAAIDESNVSGEVLEGTISDDMLPLDQLRSAAPQEAIAPSGAPTAAAASGTTTDDAAEQADESAADETAEPDAAADAGEAAD